MNSKANRVLLIEPFYTGSHAQLIDYIANLLFANNYKYDVVTMSGKKWHWRARTSALYLSKQIPKSKEYSVLFCSSVLNLCELVALRPDLCETKKVVYFHENQFVYPTQNEKDRDFQYGYNSILTVMVADVVLFNSKYNMQTFLDNITKHLRKQPDYCINSLSEEIAPKCRVLYFPVDVPAEHKSKASSQFSMADSTSQREAVNNISPSETCQDSSAVLHIVWPHRWEHDKDPELFFDSLFKLKDIGLDFKVSVLGQSYVDPMPIFEMAKTRLEEHIFHFGRLDSKSDYYECLKSAHIVVSTAKHEFFGVAVLEAVLCGCFPIVPSALVYPELYPKDCLYSTKDQLYKKLKMFCEKPYLARVYAKRIKLSSDLSPLTLAQRYLQVFEENIRL